MLKYRCLPARKMKLALRKKLLLLLVQNSAADSNSGSALCGAMHAT